MSGIISTRGVYNSVHLLQACRGSLVGENDCCYIFALHCLFSATSFRLNIKQIQCHGLCRDSRISRLLLQAQFPVVAVDTYLPVVDIFTGGTRGKLRVFLAMGTSQQITTLQHTREEEATGPSRRVHMLDHRPPADAAVSSVHYSRLLLIRVFDARVIVNRTIYLFCRQKLKL